MKKLLFAVLILGAGLFSSQTSSAQVTTVLDNGKANARMYFNSVNDTLSNADTTTYYLTIDGPRRSVTFQTNITKISGTVAGTIKIYGSLDGTNYGTTALTTINLTDASVNHLTNYTFHNYYKYKYQIITSGTQACWQKSWYQYYK